MYIHFLFAIRMEHILYFFICNLLLKKRIHFFFANAFLTDNTTERSDINDVMNDYLTVIYFSLGTRSL